MIFSIGDHVEMIKSGQKTQTRRRAGSYIVGRSYSIQPGRGKAGIVEGRIKITNKVKEYSTCSVISAEDAWDEGLYTPLKFEELYSRMYSGWFVRWAYTFEYVPRAQKKGRGFMTVYESNMYPETKTWNPFVGCRFDCLYCEKSFKRQLKRVSRNIGCPLCYTYTPHYHEHRLRKIPSAPNVFVVGTGDISFCDPDFVIRIFEAIEKHKPRIEKTYFFQTKNPVWFNKYLRWLKDNQDKVILITTLETNIINREISKAPTVIKRFQAFCELDYPRKVVTIEPVLEFDINEFSYWMSLLQDQGNLEYVWFGFDSKNCGLNEPSERKAQAFVDGLKALGIRVRGKSVRGLIV